MKAPISPFSLGGVFFPFRPGFAVWNIHVRVCVCRYALQGSSLLGGFVVTIHSTAIRFGGIDCCFTVGSHIINHLFVGGTYYLRMVLVSCTRLGVNFFQSGGVSDPFERVLFATALRAALGSSS